MKGLLAQSYVGFMTLLGIIALAGIIINNAIVLIDRIRIEIDDNGLDPPRAVVEAAQGRFRPILLTTPPPPSPACCRCGSAAVRCGSRWPSPSSSACWAPRC